MKRAIINNGIAAAAMVAALAPATAVAAPEAVTASSAPAPACPTAADGSTMDCGVQTVSGLGANKQKVLDAGGNTADLASAMMETEKMDASTYPYGDNKTDDAANFGIFKQNWMMLRTACDQFAGQSTAEWKNGDVLNTDLKQDVSCLHQSQQHYGDRWMAGHRNGSSGLENPNTEDIQNFKTAHAWTQRQIESNPVNKTNDKRFWADVPAI